MKRVWLIAALAVAVLAVMVLAWPIMRLTTRHEVPALSEPTAPRNGDERPSWKNRWETLKARVIARLDELDQREEELNDQDVAVKKAVAALAAAQRDLDVAQRVQREYEEGTAPQERFQAEAEVTLAQVDARAPTEPAERRTQTAPVPSADPPAPPADDQPASRAKLALELARMKRDAFLRLSHPRRSAELARDVERAKDQLALKQTELDQEQAYQKKLRKSLRNDALVADERRALALLAEIGRLFDAHDPKLESRLDEATALWNGADRARAVRRDIANVVRFQKAAEPRPTLRPTPEPSSFLSPRIRNE